MGSDCAHTIIPVVSLLRRIHSQGLLEQELSFSVAQGDAKSLGRAIDLAEHQGVRFDRVQAAYSIYCHMQK